MVLVLEISRASEHEYHFIEYEYDLAAKLGGVLREGSFFLRVIIPVNLNRKSDNWLTVVETTKSGAEVPLKFLAYWLAARRAIFANIS